MNLIYNVYQIGIYWPQYTNNNGTDYLLDVQYHGDIHKDNIDPEKIHYLLSFGIDDILYFESLSRK